jgi:acetylornithine deacetylase/succinyl-diaminopimelate desuccinylase-like protein
VAPAPPLSPSARADAWLADHGAALLADYAELLALPNVASDRDGIRRNAEALAHRLRARGVETELWTLEDVPQAPPIVWGRLDAPGAHRTLGIYVHYDGQPVVPEAWSTPGPWAPTLYTAALEAGGRPRPLPAPGERIDPAWRLYARSAADDKAPLPALLAALDLLREDGLAPTSNLRFLFEGEEEAGSPHLGAYLAAHRDEIEVDAWLIFDGPEHPSGRPQLAFGVRGVTGLEITMYGALRPLHSGHYGNWAPNPAMELARLLASMKDGEGRVLVAGFYDSTRPPGAAERQALDALPPIDEALREELGLAATEAGNALLAERLLLPSLNVRGLASAAVGPAARNLIPTTATASLDLRLAPGNDPGAMLDLVEAHIRTQGFHVVREEPDAATRRRHPRLARVERQGGYPATRTPMDHPLVGALAAAAEAAAAAPVVLVPSLGGSLPLHLFAGGTEQPVVIVPIVNHDNNQHAPDENLRLGNLWYGVRLVSEILSLP